MNPQETETEKLTMELGRLAMLAGVDTAMKLVSINNEIQRRARLCAPKQPYQIKYKFLPNDRSIEDMKPLTVWGASPLAACQTLVDANNWRGQSMEFQVNECKFTSDDLE